MRMRVLQLVWIALVIVGAGQRSVAFQDRPDRFLFACSVFSANTAEAELRARFGSDNVASGSVEDPNGAEGDRTEGTVLFAEDPDARLEVSWKDAVAKRQPAVIRKLASKGRWHTSTGITLGTDLKTIENLNGRPFRLAGLSFDAQGTVVSWSGGRLGAQDSAECHVGMRLRVKSPSTGAADAALERQVSGDRVFSSGHPAMQALNPTVYELFTWYGQGRVNPRLEPTATGAAAQASR